MNAHERITEKLAELSARIDHARTTMSDETKRLSLRDIAARKVAELSRFRAALERLDEIVIQSGFDTYQPVMSHEFYDLARRIQTRCPQFKAAAESLLPDLD